MLNIKYRICYILYGKNYFYNKQDLAKFYDQKYFDRKILLAANNYYLGSGNFANYEFIQNIPNLDPELLELFKIKLLELSILTNIISDIIIRSNIIDSKGKEALVNTLIDIFLTDYLKLLYKVDLILGKLNRNLYELVLYRESKKRATFLLDQKFQAFFLNKFVKTERDRLLIDLHKTSGSILDLSFEYQMMFTKLIINFFWNDKLHTQHEFMKYLLERKKILFKELKNLNSRLIKKNK